jgi:hypothetical protein
MKLSKHASSKVRRVVLTVVAATAATAGAVTVLSSAHAADIEPAQPLNVAKSDFFQLFPNAKCLIALNSTTRDFANIHNLSSEQAPGTKDLINTQIKASAGDKLEFFANPQADCNAEKDDGKVTIDRMAEKLPTSDGIVVILSREGVVTRG